LIILTFCIHNEFLRPDQGAFCLQLATDPRLVRRGGLGQHTRPLFDFIIRTNTNVSLKGYLSFIMILYLQALAKGLLGKKVRSGYTNSVQNNVYIFPATH